MARKKTFNKENQNEPVKVCGDCRFGKWVNTHANLDLNKKPICLTCPESKFHILRTEEACSKWKKKL